MVGDRRAGRNGAGETGAGMGEAKRVLFVCTGNICRSPTAAAVFRARATERGLGTAFQAESAGTTGYHVGEPPDARAQRHASHRGYDMSDQRSRRLEAADFDRFDLILGMDRSHLQRLQEMAPPDAMERVALFLDFAPNAGTRDIPDPYYGGGGAFERVLDLIETGVDGLLDHLTAQPA